MSEVSEMLAALKSNYIFIGDIDKDESKRIIGEMIQADGQDSDVIRVVINSKGGDVSEMFAIYDVMKSLRSKVHTTGVGSVMSAAVLLLAAGEKGHRLVGPHTRLLVHEISLTGAGGKLFSLQGEISEGILLQNMMEEALSKETKKSTKSIRALFATHKEEYLSPADAVEFGICDEVTK